MPFDNESLENVILDETDGETLSQKSAKKSNKRKMPRLPPGYVRVPVSWFMTYQRPCPFGQRERLFLWLLHETRFGTRSVTLTSNVIKNVELSRQERWRYLKQFEADGWVCIERDNKKAV